MYRITEKKTDTRETCYAVEKRRKFLWFEWWKVCEIECFYGCGIIVYPSIFKSREEAEKFIEQKSKNKNTSVNALIPGHAFYQ